MISLEFVQQITQEAQLFASYTAAAEMTVLAAAEHGKTSVFINPGQFKNEIACAFAKAGFVVTRQEGVLRISWEKFKKDNEADDTAGEVNNA